MIRTFSTFEDAQDARAAVVAAGVQRDLAQVRVIDDEAGPVEGNFMVGNGRTAHGGAPAAVMTGPEVPYEDNFRDVVHRGVYLLVIESVPPAAHDSVMAVLARFDAVAPNAGNG